jgi:transcription antitermination factor NusG
MTFWAIAQTQPLRERLVAEELTNAGYPVYLPRIRIKQKQRWRTPPLFPSYIFFQIAKGWWAARWARGVLRLLPGDDGPPCPIPDRIIEEIKARERGGYVVLRKKPSKLQKGQQVRVVGGRFDGHLALFEGQNQHERVKVLMELFGGLVTVELGKDDKVEPLLHVETRQ